MKIIVKHMEMNKTTGAVEGYTPVAEVAVPVEISAFGTTEQCLEYAYRYTNNVTGSWSKKIGEDANDAVTVLVERLDGLGLRSTMMGDRFEFEGKTYRVAMMGFKEVETV